MDRATFDKLTDEQKGYVSYMESSLPGSEIPSERPFMVDAFAWDRGIRKAIQAVQDME